MNPSSVQPLLQDPRIWRPGHVSAPSAGVLPTGRPALDNALPGGGWPLGAVTEILHAHPGMGELQILLPALASLKERDGWIALVAPPYIPYAPALAEAGIDLSRVLLIHPRAEADTLWSAEQALRNGNCSAVLAWPGTVRTRGLRRLQLAAEAGSAACILFSPDRTAEQASPASLRVRIQPHEQGFEVDILKARGGRPARVTLHEDWTQSLPTALHEVREPAGRQSAGPRSAGQIPLPL